MSLDESPVTAVPEPAGAITDPSVRPAFHLAIPVDDLAAAEAFYGGVLGLPKGRSSQTWIDWNLAGHQVVTHFVARPGTGGHGAGEHGAGEHGAGEHGAGEHGAGEHGAREHGAGGHGAEQHGPVRATNPVDGHDVPVPHFGLVLPVPDFHRLADRLRAAGTTFVIEPYVRFKGEVGEQWTMFFYDPAGNPVEFKAFADEAQLFAR